MVSLLIDNGAVTDSRTSDGYTPYIARFIRILWFTSFRTTSEQSKHLFIGEPMLRCKPMMEERFWASQRRRSVIQK